MKKGKKQKFKQNKKFNPMYTATITNAQITQKIAKYATEYDNDMRTAKQNESKIHNPQGGSPAEQQPADNKVEAGGAGSQKPSYYGGWEGYEGD